MDINNILGKKMSRKKFLTLGAKTLGVIGVGALLSNSVLAKIAVLRTPSNFLKFDDIIKSPSSVTANAIALFDGTTGKLIKQEVDTDVLGTIGRAVIGGTESDMARFGHIDEPLSGIYVKPNGSTRVNTKTATIGHLQLNEVTVLQWQALRVGINTVPESALEVANSESQQVLTLDQNAAGQPFIDFQGTATDGVPGSIVEGISEVQADFEELLQIEKNGTTRYLKAFSFTVAS